MSSAFFLSFTFAANTKRSGFAAPMTAWRCLALVYADFRLIELLRVTATCSDISTIPPAGLRNSESPDAEPRVPFRPSAVFAAASSTSRSTRVHRDAGLNEVLTAKSYDLLCHFARCLFRSLMGYPQNIRWQYRSLPDQKFSAGLFAGGHRFVPAAARFSLGLGSRSDRGRLDEFRLTLVMLESSRVRCASAPRASRACIQPCRALGVPLFDNARNLRGGAALAITDLASPAHTIAIHRRPGVAVERTSPYRCREFAVILSIPDGSVCC